MENAILQLSQLLHKVSNEADPALQVKLIVDSVSELFGTDVCSLYLLNEQRESVLFASHGLKAERPVPLAEGKGLIGRVITSKHLINVADAAHEEGFELIPGIGEQAFKSFCAVPLVKQGQSVGGLVVQSRRAEALPAESEALLVTLAAQLAWIVPDLQQLKGRTAVNLRIPGVRGAPGIAVAEVYVLSSCSLEQVQPDRCADPDAELQRWRELRLEVAESLSREKAHLSNNISDQSFSGIFDAYQLLLEDPALNRMVEAEISGGADIPTAAKRVFSNFADGFRALDDPYLASRADDLIHLGNKVLSVYNSVSLAVADRPQGPVILYGVDVSVSDIAAFPEGHVVGIICSQGSHLSHTAVLANAIGIPAVLGIGRQHHLNKGEEVVLDADNACIIQHPTRSLRNEYRRAGKRILQETQALRQLRELPAQTLDGHPVRLMVNSGLTNDIGPGLESGAEGIGLYRTEIPFMTCQAFPTEAEQVQIYSEIIQAFSGRPVCMRVLDIGGDKQLPYFPISDEMNPALGWRGIRFCLDNAHLLLSQIRAMLVAAGLGQQLHILIPMVSDKQQILAFKQLLADAIRQLQEEGVAVEAPAVGCMIEVPAAISQIPFWADELDFISIGSNDLSQYLLSVDRNNPRVAALYDPVHPAVIHEINRVVAQAQKAGLKISLCGELASEPVAVVLLVGMGLRSLSLGAAYLPKIKKLIRLIDQQRASEVLQQALTRQSAAEVRAVVEQYLQEAGFLPPA
ncbi:phosphoenolpyruvate--protein phosphotransferase [Neptuniibacter halophilus]|uniref:phosphoenolpyruvate--protein phosphotransferase n=1 Tax=Neptuniibacter halophilus TaxID=651666 RepID=UPI00257442F7|nr:phosphoenolpyruvate--protein phosphotransferase [Neptuniibacter halophilus]